MVLNSATYVLGNGKNKSWEQMKIKCEVDAQKEIQ